MNATDQWHLWESLGFSLGEVEASAKYLADLDKNWLESPPTGHGREVERWVAPHLIYGRDVIVMGWMGPPVRDPDLSDWRGIGRRIVSTCLHYFFGDWRQNFLYYDDSGGGAVPCDLPTSRTSLLMWLDAYCLGLAVALCLGDEAATDRLLEWPGRDLKFDEGYWDRTRADNAYQIWVASPLVGEADKSTADLLEQALGSKRKRPKLLAATAQALLAGDSAGFTRSLTSYLRNYRTSELNPRLYRTAMSVEGTALWHLARRRGLEVGGIPEDLMLMIPRP
jgi:hypothetical protein